MKYNYFYLSFLLLLLAACSGLQQSDKDFLLDQAVIRSLEAADSDAKSADRMKMWNSIAAGLQTIASGNEGNSSMVNDAVTHLVMKATENKDLNIADRRALDYIVQRLVPKDIDATVPLSEEDRARIKRAADTIESAVTFWQLYKSR